MKARRGAQIHMASWPKYSVHGTAVSCTPYTSTQNHTECHPVPPYHPPDRRRQLGLPLDPLIQRAGIHSAHPCDAALDRALHSLASDGLKDSLMEDHGPQILLYIGRIAHHRRHMARLSAPRHRWTNKDSWDRVRPAGMPHIPVMCVIQHGDLQPCIYLYREWGAVDVAAKLKVQYYAPGCQTGAEQCH